MQFVKKNKGVFVTDDSTTDKSYVQKIEMVKRFWSGKHHQVTSGINPVSLLWSDGDAHIPCDFRIYHKEGDGKTENDHFPDMLFKAKATGVEPEYILFDSWYPGLKNLEIINSYGWFRLIRFKSNRLINPDLTKKETPDTGLPVILLWMNRNESGFRTFPGQLRNIIGDLNNSAVQSGVSAEVQKPEKIISLRPQELFPDLRLSV